MGPLKPPLVAAAIEQLTICSLHREQVGSLDKLNIRHARFVLFLSQHTCTAITSHAHEDIVGEWLRIPHQVENF